jgi:putative redox protein
MATVPLDVELVWQSELIFQSPEGRIPLTLDSDGQAGPSPVQALAYALAGCMGMDVVHILTKGRFEVKACRIRLHGERAPQEPRRVLGAKVHFELRTNAPAEKVERALALSRETYCSVWHSLRTDIDLDTSFEIAP